MDKNYTRKEQGKKQSHPEAEYIRVLSLFVNPAVTLQIKMATYENIRIDFV